MEQGIEDAVVMDDKTFKSLTSKTRTDILKLLKKRNHTLSEIAEKLRISKTTAKEHLDILVEGRLIEQVPSTNKWKYYTLTKDGRKLVGEEGPKRVVITLATFVIGFLLSVYGFTAFLSPVGTPTLMSAETFEEPAVGGGARAFDEKTMAPMAEGEISEEAYADNVEAAALPPAEEPAEEIEEPEPTMMPPPDYLMLVLGIAGVAIMAMALLMLIRNRKQRSVL